MRAHAPGSVTAVFAPNPDGDGTSLGVSFATEAGVEAAVRSADETRIALDGEATAFRPVELALESLGVEAAVDLDAEIPVGAGFGASGAATLATGLAANATFDLGLSRERLVAIAHEAEIAAGTGLGDVFVQEQGGLVVGDERGIRRYERDAIVEYESYGGIETSRVLGDAALMERVTTAGRSHIDRLPAEPSMTEVATLGWSFAREIGLPTEDVVAAVSAVADAGGVGSMAMIGETVFAVGVDGVLEGRTRVASDGRGWCSGSESISTNRSTTASTPTSRVESGWRTRSTPTCSPPTSATRRNISSSRWRSKTATSCSRRRTCSASWPQGTYSMGGTSTRH